MKIDTNQDEKHLNIILQRIEVCKAYKPKFGQGKSVSLKQFEVIYKSASFYSWFGLNDPLIYAAHKAAGGITSLYRQTSLGCETVFRQGCSHLESVYRATSSEAKLFYILGNSEFYDTFVPVEQIYQSILRQVGFTKAETKILRKRNSKKELSEMVVTATKP